MSNARDTQTGISAYDVRDYVRSVERRYSCDVNYHVTVPLRNGTHHALDFRIVATGRPLGGSGSSWVRGASRPWPTGECRTLTGLMYRLVHDLERLLEERENEAKLQAQGRLFDNP